MSDIPNKPPIAEIRRVEPSYPNRVYKTTEQVDLYHVGLPKPLGLVHNSVISSIKLPEGWDNYYRPGTRRPEWSAPADVSGVKLYITYIGIPIGIKNRPKFSELVLGRPRNLSPKEVLWFDELLREQSVEPVKILSAKTMELHGNQVICVRGHSNFSADKTTLFERIYVDIDGNFNFMQEIGFYGKPGLFEKYLPAAERSFQSIWWLSEQNPDDFTKLKDAR